MTVAARRLLTPEEYLALERAADRKSEYFNGEVFATAGASRNHNRIVRNAAGALHLRLRASGCETYVADMRVKVSATGLYTYPDVLVACGEQRFEDERQDTLLNPTVIVEVLSPCTEAYDRGEKFAHYRRLDSLKEYVLIAQDRCRAERFLRQESGQEWLLTEIGDPHGELHLPSIDCRLPLTEVYERVQFPAEPAPLRVSYDLPRPE